MALELDVFPRLPLPVRFQGGLGPRWGTVATVGTPEWFEGASVADLDGGADRVRAKGAKLKAFAADDPNADADGVRALGEQAWKHFDALANAIAEGVALEEECRADKKCMAERAEKAFVKAIVLPLCQAVWGAENAQLTIAQQARPSQVSPA